MNDSQILFIIIPSSCNLRSGLLYILTLSVSQCLYFCRAELHMRNTGGSHQNRMEDSPLKYSLEEENYQYSYLLLIRHRSYPASSRPRGHTRHIIFCLDLISAVLQLHAKTVYYFVVRLFVTDSMFLAPYQYCGTRGIMSAKRKADTIVDWDYSTIDLNKQYLG